MSTTTTTMTAEDHDAAAAAYDARAAESFERCDTDGFLSQWADGIMGRKERLAAEIARDGGMSSFPAIFRDGVMVPARVIETRFGLKWGIFATADDANRRGGTVVQWIATGRKALAKHGLTVGLVRRPAEAFVDGRGHGMSGHAWAAVRVLPGLPSFDPAAPVVEIDRYAVGGSLHGMSDD